MNDNQFKEYNYVIPSHFLCAIEYGDDYLEKDDAGALENFLNDLPKGNRVFSYDLDTHFRSYNYILGNVGADCVDATLTVLHD